MTTEDPTTGAAYEDLDDEAQAEALRPVAEAAARDFGLDVASLTMITHSYNTTFEVVDAAGPRFAVRVNTNSKSSPVEIDAQQAWQLAIAEETPVRVPVPRRTLDGAWCASVPSEVLGREVLATCASWLDGPDADEMTPQVGRELGRAMALLHEHARTWRPPEGSAMPVFDRPLLGDVDRFGTAPAIGEEDRDVLARAMERSTAAFARVHAAGPVIPIHADLHGANLKWHGGRLSVFDFDDCGVGTPAFDLSVSTFYLRRGANLVEEALRAGYAEIAPLPEVDPADHEALVASRQLLLGNDLLGSSTAAWRRQAQDYLLRTVERMRHWLGSGTFRLDPPRSVGGGP